MVTPTDSARPGTDGPGHEEDPARGQLRLPRDTCPISYFRNYGWTLQAGLHIFCHIRD